MAKRNLPRTIPLLRRRLLDRGADATLSEVLDELGVSLHPVLDTEPEDVPELPSDDDPDLTADTEGPDSVRLDPIEPGPTRPMQGAFPTPHAEATTTPPARRKGLPGSLGRLEPLAELGRGGMGVVLEARDPELRRVVAVKLVGNPSSVTDAALARFIAEAQITSQLTHPNIVPVHDIGYSDDGEIYFVMRTAENGAN